MEVNFKCKIIKDRFITDDFKIYVVDVDSNVYNNIKKNKKGEYVISGNFQTLVMNNTYSVIAELDIHKTYGYQYKVKDIRIDKPTDLSSSKNFLYEVITQKQADVLLEIYPNIIDKIIKNDLNDIDLNKTKGIKQATFNKIKDKIISNFALIDIVDLFKGAITISTAKKLYEKYASIDKIKSALRKNPYKALCDISRIGFKTADSIILNIEKEKVFDFNVKDIKTSIDRMRACVEFILEENELSGNTKIDAVTLRKNCFKFTPECIDKFMNVLKENNDKIHIDNEDKSISTKIAYETEKYICDTILNLYHMEDTLNVNSELYRNSGNGTMTDEQLSTIDNIANNGVTLLTAPAGCVDCDTEFFNGVKWKKISEFDKENDLVLQFNDDRSAKLVKPQRYIKEECDNLHYFHTKYGLDQCLSDEHNLVYLSDKNNIQKITYKEFEERHNNCVGGFNGRFMTTFNYSGKGIDLTKSEIRIMVAVIADGSFYCKNTNRCRFHLKKERKQKRIEMLFKQANIEYTKHKSSSDGYYDYYFYAPRKEKYYTEYWYNCNQEQMKIISEEVLEWDGSKRGKRKSFHTTVKENADFIQFVYACLGIRSTISENDRIGQIYKSSNGKEGYVRKSIEYTVTISSKGNTVGITVKKDKHKMEILDYKTKDGYKYCFTVNSGMLVLRRNGRIFITGNCGKTHSVKSLLQALKDLGKTYMLCTPTGASSEVLSNDTEEDAGTIHRKLDYNPSNENAWGYNKDNKLDVDVVIVDEFGMVDIYLMKHLLDAIDVNRTRLLLVFDPYQLSSVGCGNIAQDLLSSGKIPTVKLTKIFRYNEGGLMQVATSIRNGEEFLPNNTNSVAILGTKKDFVYNEVQQTKLTQQIKTIYKKILNDGYELQDIAVLSSQNKGEYGTKAINKEIQSMLQKGKNNKFMMRGEEKFFTGDKVIQVVNNYKAKTEYGEEDNIFNGNTGIVELVTWDYMIVNFKGKKIKYEKSDLDQLELGYCISIHKSQGSSLKQVIVVAPKSHTFMLNSNLLYVACTRARERVYLLGNIITINRAIKIKENLERNTYLKDMLLNSK